MTNRFPYIDHRQVIETSLDGYLHVSAAGLVKDVNAAYCTLSGYSRDELLGKPLSELGSRDPAVLAEAVKNADGEARRYESIHRRKDGTLWSADVSAAYIDHQGLEMFGFFRDISDLKKSHADLRRQSDFFRLIAENLDGFVAVLDLRGVRIYNSPSYQRLLGEAAIAGTDSFLQVHPDDRDRVEQAFCEVVATGEGRHLEYRFVMPNGKVRTMESRSGVIRDSAGRVRNVAVVSYDITERKEQDAQVRDMAFSDALTGLPNRRLLMDRLQQTLAASKRSGNYNALLFLDLDNFKPINDLHGHALGDLLLMEVARRLRRLVRAEDTVARLGGDEFVVILGSLDKEEDQAAALACTIAEKIGATLAQPYLLTEQLEGEAVTSVEHRCTASIGISLYSSHETKPEDILRWADRAMYQAKEAGRNSVRILTQDV